MLRFSCVLVRLHAFSLCCACCGGCLQEREGVMLGVVDQLCSKGLLVMPGMPKPAVALVVGSAHLPGERHNRFQEATNYKLTRSSTETKRARLH